MDIQINAIEKRFSIHIEHLSEATSTNDLAALRHWKHGDVIWAEVQTKGRGQRGNSWDSNAGENLTFSLVLCPENFRAEDQFYLSKAVSVGAIEALSGFGLPAETKWPNDIYVGDRKVAGMLIENDLQGMTITRSILGIGLNVNQESFDPALPNPVSMRGVSGREFDRVDVLEKILERIFYWTGKLKKMRFAEIDEKYQQHFYRREGVYWFREPEKEPFEAAIEGVRPSGELILRRLDGSSSTYLFKEVEFIIKKSE